MAWGPNDTAGMSEAELIALSDADHRTIIAAFVPGQQFSRELIRALHFQEAQTECLDYNDHVRLVAFHQTQMDGFASYLKTMQEILGDAQ